MTTIIVFALVIAACAFVSVLSDSQRQRHRADRQRRDVERL